MYKNEMLSIYLLWLYLQSFEKIRYLLLQPVSK